MSAPRAALLAAGLVLGSGAGAVELRAPDGAEALAKRDDPAAPYGVAIGPAAPFMAPEDRVLEGPRHRLSWRGSAGQSGLELMQDVQAQLEAAGFEPVFTCASETCGGFDFRAALPVLPSPEMFVDLGGFAYVALHRGAGEAVESLAGLLASSSGKSAYLQLTLIGPLSEPAPVEEVAVEAEVIPGPDAPRPTPKPRTGQTASAKNDPAISTGIGLRLERDGHAVLDGMGFDAGQDDMGAAVPPVLQDLAAYLNADPARRIGLVGHSDWTGPDEMNRRLSRQRAEAVAEILSGALGVDPAQIRSYGAGFLAPRQSNDTDAGRAANRRVEVVLLPPAE